MSTRALSPAFIQHLLRVVDVSERDLQKLVLELVDHWSETTEEFVLRRHRELQREGVPNRVVYGQIADELIGRPVRVDPLTVRQVRRIIYG